MLFHISARYHKVIILHSVIPIWTVQNSTFFDWFHWFRNLYRKASTGCACDFIKMYPYWITLFPQACYHAVGKLWVKNWILLFMTVSHIFICFSHSVSHQ